MDYLIPLFVILVYLLSGRKKKVVRPPSSRPIPVPPVPKKTPATQLQRNSLPIPRPGVSKAKSGHIVPPQKRRTSRAFRLLRDLPNRKDVVILSEILNRRDV